MQNSFQMFDKHTKVRTTATIIISASSWCESVSALIDCFVERIQMCVFAIMLWTRKNYNKDNSKWHAAFGSSSCGQVDCNTRKVKYLECSENWREELPTYWPWYEQYNSEINHFRWNLLIDKLQTTSTESAYSISRSINDTYTEA